MKKILNLVAVLVFLSALSGVTKADPLIFITTLSGVNEVPPNASPGTGAVVVTVDGNLMTVQANFSGLLGTTTAAHIHCCVPPGVNAGVATAVPTFPGFPLGVMSGTYLNTFDLTVASTYNPAFITARGGTVAAAQAAFLAGLMGGQAYFNLHSNVFPGGEIRGQLQSVPEPATLVLISAGLVGLAAARKRGKA